MAARLSEIGIEFGHGLALELGRIEAALAALGDPHRALAPVLHVAGTNGKGSTAAFLRAIVEAAGLKAHVFTSPHLIVPNERIRVAGRIASDQEMLAALNQVAATGVRVTYFEALAAAAFLLFAQAHADYVIVETGLGGRFDATNVIARPAASVITPIAMDHQAFLGSTLAAIAFEKAGIFKLGAAAVLARQTPEALGVLEARAEAVGAAPIWRCGTEWDAYAQNGQLIVQTGDRLLDLAAPSLAGPHQYLNAGLAVATLLAVQDARFDDAAFSAGVASARWPARLQLVRDGALAALVSAQGASLWLDGAHNPHGAAALAAALATQEARWGGRTVLVAGMLSTKAWGEALAALYAPGRALVTVRVQHSSGIAAADLAEGGQTLGFDAWAAPSLPLAVEAAAQRAGAGGRVVICGSLYLAGEALALSGHVLD